ncbi:chemotaxis protein CheW [uncultured Gimesia sp.]|uniref:chemotaxis protein CheW n=1 Tax=uncultured Gimesia sp. TaxID=1678688 RepID=UPI0030D76A33|tara:strand:- start:43105 stop:43581 length:477 start_codon:yes stop_codon:yes gene_type:complete
MSTTKAKLDSSSGMESQLDYSSQYVSFRVDGQLLGVPVNMVQEVLTEQVISPTPLARAEIKGLLNLRGQIVTAVNLRKRLGLPDLEEGDSMNVVTRMGEESFSLLVDEVGDVINVSGRSMEPVPRTLDQHWRSVTIGVFQLEEGLFVILDVETILNFD